MLTRTIALAMCAAFCMPSMAAKPQIQWDPEYDFESLESFRWSDPPQASLEDSNPFLHQHIINAIEFELTKSGLVEAEEDPDVLVTYHMSTDTDVRLQSTSVGYGFGNYGRRGWGYYGYGISGPVFTDTRVVEVERGSLMVDIWDTAENQLVWRGKVVGISISGDPRKTQRNVEKAIAKMAKQATKLYRRSQR